MNEYDEDPYDGDDDEDVETELGRVPDYIFTIVAEWVLCADTIPGTDEVVAPGAKTLYWALTAHVNQEKKKRGDTSVWATQSALMKICGIKSKTTLRKYRDQLKRLGAIGWKTKPSPKNPMRKRTTYIVHLVPEAGYKGLPDVASFHIARRKAPSADA
ncbi:hypothetical protein [Streptomyces sp. NPDC088739]|uniref:hypothetical protein n=1 Tax=Streptomyces sp. NPDC088739 TaxID=3365882 RepID=UPI0038254B9F